MLDHAGHPAAAVALTFPAAEVDAAGREVLAARVARAAAQVAQRIRGGGVAGAGGRSVAPAP